MKRGSSVVVVLFVAMTLCGCTTRARGYGANLITAIVVDATLRVAHDALDRMVEDERERRLAIVQQRTRVRPTMDPIPGVVIPPPAPVREPFKPFDARTTHRRLMATEWTSCKAEGLPTGYLRAAVTFESSGRVVSTVIDQPASLDARARACIERWLEDNVSAPPFTGGEVAVSATWFVSA